MLISDIYNPVLLQGTSAEEAIFASGLDDLYMEIRRVIFDTKVVISPRVTAKKGEGATAALGLASSLNEALGIGLTSLGWAGLKAPGGATHLNTVDWFKSKKPQVTYVPYELGIGLEIQFGNNFQINEDIKRLSEAFVARQIQAGVIITPSDVFAKHKADRGAFFSDAKSKLDRHYQTLYGSGARNITPIMIIGIQHDAYNNDESGYFEITPVHYSSTNGKLVATPQPILNNAKITHKKSSASGLPISALSNQNEAEVDS